MIGSFDGMSPKLAPSVWVAPSADIIGNVTIGEHSSVWFQTVVRGDVHWIEIGEYTNIQDGSVLHVTNGVSPLKIGSRVTIGHKACLHGCTVGDNCLIGMGALILDDAVIGEGSVVAAGALVTQGKVFPPNSLIMGSPAKRIRDLTLEERQAWIEPGWRNYHAYVAKYRASGYR